MDGGEDRKIDGEQIDGWRDSQGKMECCLKRVRARRGMILQ